MTWTTHLTDDAEAYIADGGEIVYAEGGDDQIYVIPTDDTWASLVATARSVGLDERRIQSATMP